MKGRAPCITRASPSSRAAAPATVRSRWGMLEGRDAGEPSRPESPRITVSTSRARAAATPTGNTPTHGGTSLQPRIHSSRASKATPLAISQAAAVRGTARAQPARARTSRKTSSRPRPVLSPHSRWRSVRLPNRPLRPRDNPSDMKKYAGLVWRKEAMAASSITAPSKRRRGSRAIRNRPRGIRNRAWKPGGAQAGSSTRGNSHASRPRMPQGHRASSTPGHNSISPRNWLWAGCRAGSQPPRTHTANPVSRPEARRKKGRECGKNRFIKADTGGFACWCDWKMHAGEPDGAGQCRTLWCRREEQTMADADPP